MQECVRSRGSLLHADPGVPQEPGGLRQARGVPRGAGIRRRARRRLRRPPGGEHVRLHRGGTPGVDRHDPEPGRAPPQRRPARGDRLHGRALRRRAARRAARGRPRRRLRPRPGPRGHVGPVSLGATRTVDVRPSGRRLRPPRAPRPAARAPWAYVKVAEGCDRICGFCAIPSFRGKQRSRPLDDVLAEVDRLLDAPATGAPPLREVVLVAQDLASYGRDRTGPGRAAAPPPPAAPRRSPRSPGPWPPASNARGCSICTRPASPTS